jgi:hypothetical protein
VINAVLITFFLFLLVFLIALAGISLRGEVTCVSRVQRSSGVVIAMIHSLGALDHQRRDLHLIKFLYLRRPCLLSEGMRRVGGGSRRSGRSGGLGCWLGGCRGGWGRACFNYWKHWVSNISYLYI